MTNYIYLAKRSGDYYMFEYDPEIDELIKPVDSHAPEVTPGAEDERDIAPTQVCRDFFDG